MEFIVPDLFGLEYREGRSVLEQAGLTLGSVVPDNDVTDTIHAFIYRQSPDRFNEEKQLNHIRQGQIVDVWLSAQKPVRNGDSVSPASTPNSY